MDRNVIGGFFELELPSGDGGFLKYWNIPADPAYSFELARSAFAALLDELDPPNVWLPAYICRSMPAQVSRERLKFYPVGESLSPDVGFLSDAVRTDDVLVGLNYFGRAPSEAFRSFVAARPDVHFVEDCAQTIDTGLPPWADYRLFSPRKLLGVPDGGILVPTGGRALNGNRSRTDPDIEGMAPAILRFEDETCELWPAWHEQEESWRLGLQRSPRRMSRLSRSILSLAEPAKVSEARRANFSTLRRLLGDVSYLDRICGGDPLAESFVPFGFPIRLSPSVRDVVRARLWQARIYAFRHFANLDAPLQEFREEHALSTQLMTLPCDQRYGPDDMEFVAALVRDGLTEAS